MRKILIIEDELVVRSIYRRKFEMSGYEVETAEDGATGLSLLPTFRPDIIQLDIMMPGINGVEVIRHIRAWPEHRHVPILVLSSFYRPDLAAEAWKAGATKCVSKMDSTPNLVIELVEQLLSGENTGFAPKFGIIPMPKGALEHPPPSQERAPPEADSGKLKVKLDLPPSKGTGPTRPTFAQEGAAAAEPAFGKTAPPPFKTPTRPTFASATPKPAPVQPASEPAATAAQPGASGTDFRIEIRQDFLRRVPQIQEELRERVAALIKSKSTTDQLKLLHDLEGSISSCASLSGITGFSRVSHLSGALDALIKDLHKKPNQMTASVLRTIAHAMDCLNVLFRSLTQLPQEIPHSMLILAVDDEPISRRTVSVALSKANLRCIGMEDSNMALTILKENRFDLIFLDAEMPGLNGFELCAELRKLPTNQNTPVIFVTSLTKFEIRAQSSLSGGNDLIAKPFLMMELAVKALTYLLKPQPTVQAKVHPPQPTK